MQIDIFQESGDNSEDYYSGSGDNNSDYNYEDYCDYSSGGCEDGSGCRQFIMHEKWGHSMDNGFIF